MSSEAHLRVDRLCMSLACLFWISYEKRALIQFRSAYVLCYFHFSRTKEKHSKGIIHEHWERESESEREKKSRMKMYAWDVVTFCYKRFHQASHLAAWILTIFSLAWACYLTDARFSRRQHCLLMAFGERCMFGRFFPCLSNIFSIITFTTPISLYIQAWFGSYKTPTMHK